MSMKNNLGKCLLWQVFDDDMGKDDLLGRALLDTRMIVRERCASTRIMEDQIDFK